MSDVVVIGGGHNGLVAAARLAKAGKSVTLLESRDRLGGLAAWVDLEPGYRLPGLVHETGLLRPAVRTELSLADHGLQLIDPPHRLVPRLGQDALVLPVDRKAAADELSRTSVPAADAYHQYRAFFDRIGRFFQQVSDNEIPGLDGDGLPVLWQLAKLGMGMRRLGAGDMSEVLRVPPMPVVDWLEEYFDDPAIISALAAPAIQCGVVGVRAPGTAALLFMWESLRGQSVKGGPAALIASLESACKAAGVVIRTNAEVSEIVVDGGQVTAVVVDGETIPTSTVIAAVDPKKAILKLVNPRKCPSNLAHDMERFRTRGSTAKVHLCLNGPLEIDGAGRVEHLLIGEEPNDLERASDAIKYKRFSERPHLDVWAPSVSQSGLAPAGGEVVSILSHFAPYDVAGGWTDEAKAELEKTIIGRLAEYAPTLRDRIVASEVLTPVDLESKYGVTGGHLYHGEHALDQLMSLRPIARCHSHRTPITGLYLGSGGTHPGGWLSGGPGRLAAMAVLEDA